MSCNLNSKKIWQGGLAAGVVVILIEFLTHNVVLCGRWESLQKMGVIYTDPKIPYIPLAVLAALGMGLLLAWLYAAARTELHPGPVAAIKVGLAVGFIAAVPGNLGMAAFSPTGRYVALVSMIGTIVACVIGTYVAAWIYKPKA